MNATIFSSSADFGFILSSAFEYVDMGFLVLFLLSFFDPCVFWIVIFVCGCHRAIDGGIARQNASFHKVG